MPDRYETTAVPFAAFDPRRLTPIVGESRSERLEEATARVRDLLAGRRVVNVNSTANGGGVAEMLRTLLGYVRHAGIGTEWLVIDGPAEFFAVTKRVHNGLYGGLGDGLELDRQEREVYERVLAATLPSLREALRPGDLVIVHDPQPAGLIPALLELDVRVIWRCHVGIETTNDWTERAWGFLRPYVERATGFVFSHRSFAPPWIEASRLTVIAPSVDPFSPKNKELEPAQVSALLGDAGLVAGGVSSHGRLASPARVVRHRDPPGPATPLVVQVSRWDPMKDMPGVLAGFVEGVSTATGAQLVLAGPAVDGVDDDPEATEVWEHVVRAWHELATPDRARVHLAAVPMDDLEENALVINALQRRADVVVQKSLAEGFGLTVSEAMWKSRPVVASAVGGIVDQVVDGVTGLLLEPTDLDAFGRHVTRLLDAPADARRMGESGKRHVVEMFLTDRHLLQYAELLEQLLAREAP